MSEPDEDRERDISAATPNGDPPTFQAVGCEANSQAQPPAPGGSEVSALLESAARVEGQLSALNETVEKRLRYDQAKESAFDRLYAELDATKKQAASEELRPLFIDLALLYDRIDAASHTLAQPDRAATAALLVHTLGEELLEILCRREVELIQPLSNTFDATIQRAIGTEPAESETENNQIARVVRRGFRHCHRLLRPEEVIVKKSTVKTQTQET